MADKSFDAVIVGGGNKALILAMYLTKYGKMSVGIFEDRHELGGGWSCEEPAPGFLGNTCSTSHAAGYHIPVYQDFPEWESYGARYDHTDVSLSTIFKEDHSCVTLYATHEDSDPDQERTAQQIARFSKRDADQYLQLWEKYRKYWKPAMEEWMFTPAKPLREPDALDKLVFNPEAGIDPMWLFQSPFQVYTGLYESLEMQNTLPRLAQSVGFQNDLAGSGFGALLFLFYWSDQCYVVGGTHQLTHASQRVILENGGEVFTNSMVKKILIESGRAVGIELLDGTQVKADKAVISDVDPYQLCFNLIGEGHLSPKIMKRVKNLSRDWITIAWFSWALRERPRYIAENFNPDVGRSMILCPADRDLGTYLIESCERKLYKWPSKTNIAIAYHEDPLRSPPGIDFTILTEEFVVPAFARTEQEWKQWEEYFPQRVIDVMQEYAPNMTWDNVIGYSPVTPFYTANQCKNYGPAGNWCVIDNIPSQFGKLRPIPELASGRMPVKSLYATGSAWHPFGSAHSAQGYNCYKVMAEDLGLDKPWEEGGRIY